MIQQDQETGNANKKDNNMTEASSSFATSFWGRDDRGPEVIINKMNQGSQTMEELQAFLKERISIEEDYSRRMMNLSKKFQVTGIYETGQLRESLDTLRLETEQISKSHLNESRKLKYEIYDRTETYLSNFKATRKPVETSIENLLRSKKALTQRVLKLKDKYQLEVTKLNTYLAQEALLLGKEMEKNRDRIYKQQEIVTELRAEYQVSCSKLEELNKIWIQEWKGSSCKLQDLEVERIQYLVRSLWEYSNLVSSACVSDDTSCENLRKSLEFCDPDQEIQHFISKFQTGTKIYSSPKFVDFINGASPNSDGTDIVLQKFGPSKESRTTSAHTTSSLHSQQSTLAPLNPSVRHNAALSSGSHLQRRAPPSDDGQTSISNPSTNSMLHREESAYSNPTSISSFTDTVDHELRSSQNWNSPMRRRSRNSAKNSINLKEGSKSSSLNRRSFILDQGTTKPPVEYVDLTSEDPLRATLEDLKIGGNGDMNKFKEYMGTSISQSRSSNNNDPFRDSTTSQNTNGTTIRPKSMIVEASNPMMDQSKQSRNSNRLSFHAGLRSQSKSSINLQAKLSTHNLPNMTANGRRVLQHVRALFDFNASIEGEVSFKEHDILSVVHMQEDGWWECENMRTGQTGLAPYNYVEKI